MNNVFSIADKQVLTKVANRLTVDASVTLFQETVNINGRLSYVPTGSTTQMGGDVFWDNWNMPVADLSGSGSLEQKVVEFVANKFQVTILQKL
jgi:hypothetical protein